MASVYYKGGTRQETIYEPSSELGQTAAAESQVDPSEKSTSLSQLLGTEFNRKSESGGISQYLKNDLPIINEESQDSIKQNKFPVKNIKKISTNEMNQ